jgi:deazaflavin-dependent oxidoreductase (nitroreductase family)
VPSEEQDSWVSDWNQQVIEEFRANGGTVTTNGFGRRLVLVHHLGARSGTERVNPVAAIRQDDGSWLIAASAGGADKNPDWYHNLVAHPDVTIETPDDGEVSVHVVDLTGTERDAGWAQFTAMSAGFAGYEQKTSRVIPVLRLSPR